MSGIPASIHRYEIEGRIGEGGMGALYLARDPILDRQVAIKVLREGFDNRDLRERFVREAKSAARLTHVNIVRIFDFGEHEGQPYIAMEYIPGETLADKIRRRAQLPLAERLRYMEDLCSGLAHAHKAQIVHRDVKPANVMISPEGELKILDFGIARVGDSKMTQAGMLVGTLNYMSPEQLGGGQVDHRSDIFAVGALFYELLAYRQAFPGGLHDGLLHRILHAAPEPIEKFCPDIDPEVSRIILQALEKDPARRYQSLGDLERDIERVRDWLPAEATQIVAAPDAATTAIPVPRPSDAGRPRSTPPVPKWSPGSAAGERPGSAAKPPPKTAAPSDRTVPMPVVKPPRPPAKPATDPALIEDKRASEVKSLIESAQKALDGGRYAEAIGAAEAALLRMPDQPAALALAARARRERQAAVAAAAAQAAVAALASGHLEVAERHLAEGAAADTDHPEILAVHVKVKEARAAAESDRARRAAEGAERERARAAEADAQRQDEDARRREQEAQQRQALEARRQAEGAEQRRREAEAAQQRQAAAAGREAQVGEQLRIAEDAIARAQAAMALAALDRALEIDPGARVGALRVRAEALREEQARTEEGRRQREKALRSAAARERIRTIVQSWPVRIAAGALVLVTAGALILPRLPREPPASPPPPAQGPAAEPAPATTPPAPVAVPDPEPPSGLARARSLYSDGQRVSALEALRSADPALEGTAERGLAELWLTDARLAVAGSAERALRGGARSTSAAYRAAAATRAEGDKAREQQHLPEALLAYWRAIEMYDALQPGRPAAEPQPAPPTSADPATRPAPPALAPSTPVSTPPGSSVPPPGPLVSQPRPADTAPPAADPQAERESILRTVYAFAAAMNNREAAAVQRFRRLSSAERKQIEDLANLRTYTYALTPTGAPSIDGGRATLRCVRQQTFTDSSRRTRDQNDTVLVALEKEANGWVIASVTLAR